jgi:hypothetical protein
MNINNNNTNPTDNFARPGKVLQQVFHTNGTVFLDQSHDHHDSNDKDLGKLFHHGNRTRTSEEALEDRSKDNNLFDFFSLIKTLKTCLPPQTSKIIAMKTPQKTASIPQITQPKTQKPNPS